jgi:hypothetical protein
MPAPPGGGVGVGVPGVAAGVGVVFCFGVFVGVVVGGGVVLGMTAATTLPEEAVVTSADTSGVAPLKVLAVLTFQIVWLCGPSES